MQRFLCPSAMKNQRFLIKFSILRLSIQKLNLSLYILSLSIYKPKLRIQFFCLPKYFSIAMNGTIILQSFSIGLHRSMEYKNVIGKKQYGRLLI